MKQNSWLCIFGGLIALFLGSCATPTTPPGGPPDEMGPTIIQTEPETGTTDFNKRSIILHFSEFVNRSSLQQAIIVEPDIGISYELDWGRRSVAIEFENDIPDLTTLIVTIGTEFTDMNGNKMASPQKIAVSTGPEIDKGKIFGKVMEAQSGEGAENQHVLLFREPFDLTKKADYIAGTDTSGTFQFSYLREGTYKIFWVDDRNRNKIWEPEQERAQPFDQEFVELAKAGSDTVGTVYITSVDTTKPDLQGVGLFSSQRLRMRFSENIQLTDSSNISVTDTLGKELGNAIPLYIQPNEQYIMFAQSEITLEPNTNYTLDIDGITDESANPLEEVNQNFTGSGQQDTTKQRIIKRNTPSGYYPNDPFEITYAKVIDESVIGDSLKVVEGDSLFKDWPFEIDQNILRILPNKQWKDGLSYEIRVWDPKVEDYRKFSPQIWHQSQMGAINVIMQDSTLKNLKLRIENKESGISRDTSFSGQIEIQNLPPLNYKVMVFQDQNGNDSWDFGQVSPFIKPEPYFIQTRVPVKKGLTGDLTVVFQN